MTLKEQIHAEMDSAEGTHMWAFLNEIYRNALYWDCNNPRMNLQCQINDWFGPLTMPLCGSEESHAHAFTDAMMQGMTVAAAAEAKRLLYPEDSETSSFRTYFERRLILLIWSAIGDKSCNDRINNPITRLETMLNNRGIPFNMSTAYGKEFLDILKITPTSCSTEDADVANAAEWLLRRMFKKMTDNSEKFELYEGAPDTPTTFELPDGAHSAPVETINREQPEREKPIWYREFQKFLLNIRVRTNATFGRESNGGNYSQLLNEYLRNLTALLGYDITKGLSPETDLETINEKIINRFDDVRNDKVVLANVGSILQVCKLLSTSCYPGQQCEFDDAYFRKLVNRLYDTNLGEYGSEIKDFRYHVMSHLKGDLHTNKQGN